MRFLHIADVHLDTAFAARSEALRAKLQWAVREAFRRSVAAAIDEGVDALLIAGDLLDRPRISFASERLLLDGFAALADAGVQVVYATGNHDPGSGVHVATLRWPDHVTVVSGADPATVPIADRTGALVGHVTAVGHATDRETDDLSRRLRPPADASPPHVALLHALVTGSSRRDDLHGAYAPCRLDALKSAGFHYWALGHVHGRVELASSPPIRYPGNLQGRDPRETGPKGGLLVDLSDPGRPDVEFREFAPVRWEKATLDGLESAADLDSLARLAATEWRATAADRTDGPADSETVVRLELLGPSPLWRRLHEADEVETLEDELAARLDVLAVEIDAKRVRPPVRCEDHVERRDVLGAALSLIRSVRDGSRTLDVHQADLAGFDARRDASPAAYARRLLAGGGEELIVRMVAPAADEGRRAAGQTPAAAPAKDADG